jgi:hypothetical protein
MGRDGEGREPTTPPTHPPKGRERTFSVQRQTQTTMKVQKMLMLRLFNFYVIGFEVSETNFDAYVSEVTPKGMDWTNNFLDAMAFTDEQEAIETAKQLIIGSKGDRVRFRVIRIQSAKVFENYLE